MPVTRSTPNKGGRAKKTTQSDDVQVEQVQPTNNTAQKGEVQPTNNTAQKGEVQPANNTTQVGEIQPANNTAQVRELTLAKAGSTSGTQPSDQMAQMLLMMQKTFDEQLKFQREQQKHQDSQLPPLEKVPKIDWTHNDGLHSHYTMWKEQWNAIFKSDYLFASDAVKVHKLYRHIGDEGQKKIKQWKLNLDEITPDQLFEHLDEECKPGGSAYRSRSDLWHNTKQGNMTLDDFYNKIERLCDLCSFSPEEYKAFHRDAFLFNLSNQGTTQWVIEQLSKEDANPSKLSPQHIKNLAKTIEQNRATGQYLSTNANTGENASINLLRHQHTRISEKKYQKPNKSKHSQFNQQEQSPQPNKKSCSQWNDNDESDNKDHKNKKKFKSDDCTQCGNYKQKEGFRCPASQYKCKICSKMGHFPKICFFKDEK